jgi:hypothetical protein
MDDGVTHSFGEPHDEEWDNDWLPMPYYDLPGDSLMRSDSFGELIGGLSGLINLQNYHHQGPAALLSNLNPASQGSPSLKGALTMENALENHCSNEGINHDPSDNTALTHNQILGSRDDNSQIKDSSLPPSEVELGESKASSNKSTVITRRRGRGRKRRRNMAKSIIGEKSKILFVVAPLSEYGHRFRMKTSNNHFAAVWSYLKTRVNKGNDILVGGDEGGGTVDFGDEMMMVAMEFLCSLLDAKEGTNTLGGGVVKGRIVEEIYSDKIITLLTGCHFMSSR